jgi:hypothetical protein
VLLRCNVSSPMADAALRAASRSPASSTRDAECPRRRPDNPPAAPARTARYRRRSTTPTDARDGRPLCAMTYMAKSLRALNRRSSSWKN